MTATGRSQPINAVAMVITDKPTDKWRDSDLALFETNLSNIARQFKNTVFLLTTSEKHNSSGFEARLLTIASPDGQELRDVISWPENTELESLWRESGYDIEMLQAIEKNHVLRNMLIAHLGKMAAQKKKDTDIRPEPKASNRA